MKSDTGMPRGMLRGCQLRASNLESYPSGVIILMVALRVAKSLLWSAIVSVTEFTREKDWWENISR